MRANTVRVMSMGDMALQVCFYLRFMPLRSFSGGKVGGLLPCVLRVAPPDWRWTSALVLTQAQVSAFSRKTSLLLCCRRPGLSQAV